MAGALVSCSRSCRYDARFCDSMSRAIGSKKYVLFYLNFAACFVSLVFVHFQRTSVLIEKLKLS